MARVKSCDTKPEMIVRRLAHGMGYRFRLHGKDLPGRPDLVFPGRRKIIFVHGCFWHRHDAASCPKTRTPKTNVDFWEAKFSANKKRDARAERRLRAAGWSIAVVWECQTKDDERLARRLKRFLDA